MKARNEEGQEYDSWEDLVAAEANGFVVVGIVDRPNTVPVVVGPYEDQPTAKRAQARLRNKWKKSEKEEHGVNAGKVTVLVRHLWKDERI